MKSIYSPLTTLYNHYNCITLVGTVAHKIEGDSCRNTLKLIAAIAVVDSYINLHLMYGDPNGCL